MKAKVKMTSTKFDNSYPRTTEVQMETTEAGFTNLVGTEVYVYPKSRWGMFIDWLLRA